MTASKTGLKDNRTWVPTQWANSAPFTAQNLRSIHYIETTMIQRYNEKIKDLKSLYRYNSHGYLKSFSFNLSRWLKTDLTYLIDHSGSNQMLRNHIKTNLSWLNSAARGEADKAIMRLRRTSFFIQMFASKALSCQLIWQLVRRKTTWQNAFKTNNFSYRRLYLLGSPPVWPDCGIFWTFGQLFKACGNN